MDRKNRHHTWLYPQQCTCGQFKSITAAHNNDAHLHHQRAEHPLYHTPARIYPQIANIHAGTTRHIYYTPTRPPGTPRHARLHKIPAQYRTSHLSITHYNSGRNVNMTHYTSTHNKPQHSAVHSPRVRIPV